jgi:hypothetical protein
MVTFGAKKRERGCGCCSFSSFFLSLSAVCRCCVETSSFPFFFLFNSRTMVSSIFSPFNICAMLLLPDENADEPNEPSDAGGGRRGRNNHGGCAAGRLERKTKQGGAESWKEERRKGQWARGWGVR